MSKAPRLLQCLDCTKLIKVPSEDDDPRNDALDDVVRRHQHQEIPEHLRKGGNLVKIPQDTWDLLGEETVINSALEKLKWEADAYRDQLREDAGRCFRQHGNPDVNEGRHCIDYNTDSKRLGVTKGRPKDQQLYLCQFCPYTSSIVTAIRHQKGMYS